MPCLPDKRQQLEQMTVLLRQALVDIVILFGSHARGDWVEAHENLYFTDYPLPGYARPSRRSATVR